MFTDGVIRTVSKECKGVVFLLWGKQAQDKARLVNGANHLVLQCAHPSVRAPAQPPRRTENPRAAPGAAEHARLRLPFARLPNGLHFPVMRVARSRRTQGLSAHRGFFGCKHFSKTNEYLEKNGGTAPVDWDLSQ